MPFLYNIHIVRKLSVQRLINLQQRLMILSFYTSPLEFVTTKPVPPSQEKKDQTDKKVGVKLTIVNLTALIVYQGTISSVLGSKKQNQNVLSPFSLGVWRSRIFLWFLCPGRWIRPFLICKGHLQWNRNPGNVSPQVNILTSHVELYKSSGLPVRRSYSLSLTRR